MEKRLTLYTIALVAALFVWAGCAKQSKALDHATEHPRAEHPEAEHPAAEKPAADHSKAEHPAAEHPKAEHPAAEHPKAEHPAAGQTANKTCPVMVGQPVNQEIFVEHNGRKIYFCCKGCDRAFKEDPEKYLKNL